jgi:hypothetical protein
MVKYHFEIPHPDLFPFDLFPYQHLEYDGTPVSSIGENMVALPQKVWAKRSAKPRPFYERRQSEDA